MRIVVCVKQIVDPRVPLTVHGTCGELEVGFGAEIPNPADLVAVRAAAAIRAQRGGQVTVLTFGPPTAEKALRRCLASGADAAVHLRNPDAEQFDHFSVASILATEIKGMTPDLVLCGSRTADWGTGFMGALLAEELGLPLVSGVTAVDLAVSGEDFLCVQRKIERGGREIIHCPLPALLCLDERAGEQDYPSLPDHLRSLRQEVAVRDLHGTGFSARGWPGGSGRGGVSFGPPIARQKKVFAPESSLTLEERMKLLSSGGLTQKSGIILRGRADEMADRILAFLNRMQQPSVTK